QDGVERLDVAATLRVPLPAPERRSFPPGDAAGVIENRRGAFRPTWISNRLVPFAACDQRFGLRSDRKRNPSKKQKARRTNHGRFPLDMEFLASLDVQPPPFLDRLGLRIVTNLYHRKRQELPGRFTGPDLDEEYSRTAARCLLAGAGDE